MPKKKPKRIQHTAPSKPRPCPGCKSPETIVAYDCVRNCAPFVACMQCGLQGPRELAPSQKKRSGAKQEWNNKAAKRAWAMQQRLETPAVCGEQA